MQNEEDVVYIRSLDDESCDVNLHVPLTTCRLSGADVTGRIIPGIMQILKALQLICLEKGIPGFFCK